MARLTHRAVNTVSIQKGLFKDGGSVLIWDMISPCIKEKCGIYTRCRYGNGVGLYPYETTSFRGVMCVTQKRYLDNVVRTLVMNRLDTLNQEDMTQLGLFVVPLFGHLIKLKITEASVDSSLLEDPKTHKLYINPVYKEIRETMRTIQGILRSVGMDISNLPQAEDYINGDPSYYDRMRSDDSGQESFTDHEATEATQAANSENGDSTAGSGRINR